MRRLLRIRDMRLYLFGQAFSLFGDNAMWLAAGIWVKTLTGSNSASAFTFFAFALPQVFAPAWGMVVDRLRRRPLLIAVNLATGAAMLPLLLVHDADDVWIVYLVMVAYGVGGSIMSAAQGALLVEMVPDELLGDANGALRSVQEGLRLIAPLVGAGLFTAAGGGAVALLNAGTFVVAAVTLLFLRVQESTPESGRARDGGRAQRPASGTSGGPRCSVRWSSPPPSPCSWSGSSRRRCSPSSTRDCTGRRRSSASW